VVQENNRYLIYELLGRNVEIRLSARQGGQRLKGVVDKVCRDIFENMVKVTVSGQTHEFQEPSAIVHSDGDIHFLYGDIIEDVEIEDEEFQVPDYNAYDESLHEHLKRTEKSPVSRTVIKVGDVKRTPRNRWRSRVAV
jgi:hypothetical protein